MEGGDAQDDAASSGDPLDSWAGQPLRDSSDLLYVLKLTNMSENPMKYRINFAESNADLPANLVWPKQSLVGSIDALATCKVVAVLPKVEADNAMLGGQSDLSEIQKLAVGLVAEIDQSKVKKDVAG